MNLESFAKLFQRKFRHFEVEPHWRRIEQRIRPLTMAVQGYTVVLYINLCELDNFGETYAILNYADFIVRKILLTINFAQLKFVRYLILCDLVVTRIKRINKYHTYNYL